MVVAVAVVVLIGLGSAPSMSRGEERLPWQSDLATAQELSLKHGRPLLIFVMTKNCGFCTKMEQKTWSDEAVNQRLQTAFVPLRLDAEKHPELAAQLGVEGFPTTLIYGANRKLLGHFIGYAPPDRVLQTLDQLLPPGRLDRQQ
jgi:protein disulfide-isomerase